MKRICKQCGKEFEITESEIRFFESKNLELPKRCKDCRAKNKKEETAQPERQQSTGSNRTTSSQKNYLVIAILAILFVVGSFFNHDDSSTTNDVDATYNSEISSNVTFRNDRLRDEHFEKHGKEMGFSSASAYEAAAAKVVNDDNALHKYEAEDGDDVYYLEQSNEFVIVSTDGYIRTYFKPNDGIAYFNRQ